MNSLKSEPASAKPLTDAAPPARKIDPTRAYRWRIRVKKSESAFVYALFEAQEGWLAYSTPGYEGVEDLAAAKASPYRDLELQVPMGYVEDVRRLLARLGDLIYVLDLPEEN